MLVRGRLTRRSARVLTTVCAAVVLSLVAGCLPMQALAPPVPNRTLQFMAGYKPQANLPFVGTYVAQERGYFAEQGLTVEITHATGQGEHLKLLLQGSVDVTTGAADSVLARRAEDLPVVSIALLGQRSQSAYAVLASSDIRSPKDWVGHTVGFKIYPTPEYLAVLAANGVDRSRIQEVPVGFDPRLLAAGKVDVYPVFESNEPDTLERLGVPVRVFRPTDSGVPGLGLTYLSSQRLVDADPDLLVRFLKAALRGVEDADRDPERATDIVMKYAPQEDRAHQLAMLKVELDMARGPATQQRGIGWSTHEQWQALQDSLLTFGGLKAPVDVDSAFTNRVLERIYRNGQLTWP